MDVRITPRPLSGRVLAVPSKSDVHRALICAALSDGPTLIKAGASNRDIEATAACLNSLGASVVPTGEGGWQVTPLGRGGDGAADCGESGSTLRFILPIIPALGQSHTVTGHGRLPERPLSPLREELCCHGAVIEGGRLPLAV